MEAQKDKITIETLITAPVEKVWEYWTSPAHIVNWCQASDDWHAPYAENDVQVNGRFKTTMAAKDGSVSFDFTGTYTVVKNFEMIEYLTDDDRKVSILFLTDNNASKIIETFEAESLNSLELQKAGWQAILDNFKKYVDANS
ncbi:MAG: SRPBCC domain-containing protein [Ignavibacteriales bacterium]|nr:SRPBCC domain-containing protein [Ignavibacteriales bacterium]